MNPFIFTGLPSTDHRVVEGEAISLSLTDNQFHNVHLNNFSFAQLSHLAKIGLLALNKNNSSSKDASCVDGEQSVTSNSDQGMTSNSDQGMTSNSDQGMTSNSDQGMTSNSDQGMTSNSDHGIASKNQQSSGTLANDHRNMVNEFKDITADERCRELTSNIM